MDCYYVVTMTVLAMAVLCLGSYNAGAQAPKYFMNKGSMNYQQAAALCRSQGSVLASIMSTDDQTAVAKLAEQGTQIFGYNGFWLGGRSFFTNGSFIWTFYNAVLNFTNWYTGEPIYEGLNNTYKQGTCIRIDYTGQWDDVDCAGQLEGAICENVPMPSANDVIKLFTGYKYFSVKRYLQNITWYEASELCSESQGHLASIKSADDQEVAAFLADDGPLNIDQNGYWLGGLAMKSSDPYVWIGDNTSLTYTNWLGGQPDYKGWIGDNSPICLRIDTSGKWDDAECSQKLVESGAICEFDATTTAKTTQLVSTTTTQTDTRFSITSPKSLKTSDQTPTLEVNRAETVALFSTPTSLPVTTKSPVPSSITLTIDGSMQRKENDQSFPIKQPDLVSNPEETIQSQYPANDLPPETPGVPPLTAPAILSNCTDIAPNRTAPPNNGFPTIASTIFAVDRLVEFRDIEETITVSAYLYLKWNVSTCKKNEWLEKTIGETNKDDHRERIYVARKDEVWLPDYHFTTSSDDIFMKGDNFGEDLLVTLLPNFLMPDRPYFTLEFYYLRLGHFTAQCPLNLSLFPFDSATCDFSFAMTISKLQAQFAVSGVACPLELRLTEWRFVECRFSEVGSERFHGYDVSTVTFSATLRRKPEYYLTNLLLPNVVLFALEMSTFLMPAYLPDRPAFSMTILLSITFTYSILVEQVPKSSGSVLLKDLLLCLALISAVITFYHLTACYLCSKRSKWAKLMNRRFKRSNMKLVNLVDLLACLVGLLGFISLILYTAIAAKD